MVFEPAAAAAALEVLVLRSAPSRDDIGRLVGLHELDGRPDEAVRALDAVTRRFGPRPEWLRLLADLQTRHVRYRDALRTWEAFARHFGRSSEEMLARMALHWRLDEADGAATLADDLRETRFDADVDGFRVRLLAEIAWRYRKPWLGARVAPLLECVADRDERIATGSRLIETLRRDRAADATRVALSLWKTADAVDAALFAMRQALARDDATTLERLLRTDASTARLQTLPEYWSLVAEARLRGGDVARARQSYERALALDSSDIEAVGGLLWIAIEDEEAAAVDAYLDAYRSLAPSEPDLWAAFMMADALYGDPSASLDWFDRLIDGGDVDPGLLDDYADALDEADLTSAADRVRRYLETRALSPSVSDADR